jgi:two-component system response regulator RegA
MLDMLSPDPPAGDLATATSGRRSEQPLSWRNPGPTPPGDVTATVSSLLLVDDESGTRQSVQRLLTTKGFAVTGVGTAREALAIAAETPFAYAVVEIRLGDGDGVAVVRHLRKLDRGMRIVVVTGFASFASVIVALRAGAVDYLPKPIQVDELESALLGRQHPLPPVPDTPIGLDRVLWEHVQRIFEQCDRNVTRTAQRLRMHRRTLQRILSKHAPRLRAI